MDLPCRGYTYLDWNTISNICGSISVACWLVVSPPQIVKNFRRHSAKGVSSAFVGVLLVGDVCNVLAALLQHALLNLIVTAAYFSLVDVTLLLQVLYYHRRESNQYFGTRNISQAQTRETEQTEDSPLLQVQNTDACHPLLPGNSDETREVIRGSASASPKHYATTQPGSLSRPQEPASSLSMIRSYACIVLAVCLAGIFGWALSASEPCSPGSRALANNHGTTAAPHPLGQVLGYLSALLYLGARTPQILLNYRRRSTEGVSLLFFIFACLGNVTLLASIILHHPHDIGAFQELYPMTIGYQYWRHIVASSSWILGSSGSLVLDSTVIAQFVYYRSLPAEVLSDGDVQDRHGERRS